MSFDGLPMDGATTRLHKLYLLAEYVSNFPNGVNESKLINYGVGFGNRAERILEYITTLVSMNFITRRGSKYYVETLNFREWAERKGFIDVPKDVRCIKCGQIYNTNHSKCPACDSFDREEITEDNMSESHSTHTYTHTPSNLLYQSEIQIEPAPLSEPPEETAHQPTHIHTHIEPEDRPVLGAEAELRVVDLLGRFGEARLGRGAYGEPDVFWGTDRFQYGVEVKSVANGSKCNSFKLNRKGWDSFCEFCVSHGLKPLLVVEERVNGSKFGDVYHLIPVEAVDFKLNNSQADRVSFSVYELSTLHFQAIRSNYPFLLRAVF